MKVFLSWSGLRSRNAADALADWLPRVIQAVDPWKSADIEKGGRWNDEIAAQLEATRVGIICLTPENLTAPWVLFEAGALSKTKDAHVCTFLVGVEPTEVEPPLAQFQHTRADRLEVMALVETLNMIVHRAGERSIPEKLLSELFSTFWPQLEQTLYSIRSAKHDSVPQPRRSDRNLLEEVLSLVRSPASTSAAVRYLYEIELSSEIDPARLERFVEMLLLLPNIVSSRLIHHAGRPNVEVLSISEHDQRNIIGIMQHLQIHGLYRFVARLMSGWPRD